MSKQWRKLAENEKDTLPVERVGFTGCGCILEELCDHLNNDILYKLKHDEGSVMSKHLLQAYDY